MSSESKFCILQVNIIRIFRQFELFQQYQQRLSAQVGQAQAKRLVNDALVLITLGGNDFVNNYFLTPFSARSRQFSIPNYCRYLISEYRKVLRVIPINFKIISNLTCKTEYATGFWEGKENLC